jgi:translation initiation factor IF-1
MSREGLLEVDGVVTSLLPNLMARVLLDNGQEILAMSAGRLRRHRIRLLVGDRVTRGDDALRSEQRAHQFSAQGRTVRPHCGRPRYGRRGERAR